MANELTPTEAANLAFGAYTVNGGDAVELKAFLANGLFSPGIRRKQVLNSQVGGRVLRAANDGFGICAQGGGHRNGELFLIFRGTTTANKKADFVTDARIGIERSETGWPVHVGFNHAFISMLPEIRQFIAKSNITGPIHCIGHSLGGAVATLAADWVRSTLSRPVKLYTFGQPRVGLGMFASSVTKKLGSKNIHRVFHTTDPVPMVPVFPYLHSPLPGYGRRITSENPIISGEAHKMALYVDHPKNRNWEDFSAAPPINTHEQAIKEWLESKAFGNASCPQTFEWLERALIWLLTKQLAVLTYGIQWPLMGIHTFIDKVAWVLAKGIEVGEKCSYYVKLSMRKVAAVLGIKIREDQGLTRGFFPLSIRNFNKARK